MKYRYLFIALILTACFMLTGCEELSELSELNNMLGELSSQLENIDLSGSSLLDELSSELDLDNNSEQSQEDLLFFWEDIYGCWGNDERFVYFTYDGENSAFLSGLWGSPVPYGRDAAIVSSAVDFGNGLYTLSAEYRPIEDNAADSLDLLPLGYTISIDISDLENGNIRVEAPDDQWRDYTYKGICYEDVYDEMKNVQYATFSEMQSLWTEMSGLWTNADGGYVSFEQADSNTLLFEEGMLNSGGRGYGTFEKAMTSFGEIPMKFIIHYPAVSSEANGELPAYDQVVYIDITDMYTKSILHIQLGEEGQWREYTFAQNRQ